MVVNYKTNPFVTYKMYVAIKKHFTTLSYDYIKYRGKINATETAFKARDDKYFFEKLSRKYNKEDLENFFVANFAVNGNLWVGTLANEMPATANYKAWLKRQETLFYNYQEELKLIKQFIVGKDIRFKDIVISQKKGKHPLLFQFLLRDMISIETFCILDKVISFTKYFNRDMKHDDIWEQRRLVTEKYQSFINIDLEKYKNTTYNIMQR